jgi:alkylhydroperoxidase family enzyme
MARAVVRLSRIAPLERPWPDWFEQAMAHTMPPGREPLALFRAVATSHRAWDKFAGGALLDKGPLSLRDREIVIDRTTARCGCSYEWGVHVALFGERAGLGDEQLQDTALTNIDPALWSVAEIALLETVDALLDLKRLSDVQYRRLAADFSSDQILEIVQLVAFYHGVSLICGALDLPPEPGMPSLPS